MGMSEIREEIRRRIPRLTMSLIITVIFLIISSVVEQTRDVSPLRNITIPGLERDAIFLVGILTLAIAAIFLVRALSDALVLGDIVTDIIIRRLGIKEERSPKRAARDLIYIIVIILIVTAVSPFVGMLSNNSTIGSWLTLLIIYGALGIIIVLIYDIGRILYRIIEQRAESLADRLSKIAEQNKKGE